MVERHDVVVIGGGQAGLVMSWHLQQRGVDHVVLERAEVGERWRTERWDSLMFQFTNDWLSLPGYPYDGEAPDDFAHHSEVLRRIRHYRRMIGAPVREHTTVERLAPGADGWEALTSAGPIRAGAVVSATGPFQRPYLPPLAEALSSRVVQVHASSYRSPAQLPPGGVLVVGGGASGLQIAEELLEAGRPVCLAVSRHRRMPRRYRGRDLFWWLERWGFLDRTRDQWPDGLMPPSLVVTGVCGGHDVDVRQLRADGAVVLGRLLGVDGDRLAFADDAETLLAAADVVHDDFVVMAEEDAARHGLDLATDDREPASRSPVPAVPELDLRAAGVTAVVWCTGYRYDLGWIDAPVLDSAGAPVQVRGVTPAPGLYFLGLHWMHSLRSGLFSGVAGDAGHLTEDIVTRLGRAGTAAGQRTRHGG
jgi:putative flavoprotein involved in K+ transport